MAQFHKYMLTQRCVALIDQKYYAYLCICTQKTPKVKMGLSHSALSMLGLRSDFSLRPLQHNSKKSRTYFS